MVRPPRPGPCHHRLCVPVLESLCMFKAPDAQPPATAGGSLDAAETREGSRQMWPAGLGGRWQCREVGGRAQARLSRHHSPTRPPLLSSLPFPASFPCRLLLQASACSSSARPFYPYTPIRAQSPRDPLRGNICHDHCRLTILENSSSWNDARGARMSALPGTWVRGGKEGSEAEVSYVMEKEIVDV